MIEFDSFYRMIKQLDIIVDFDSANSFKKYLAEEGVLSLSNMDDIQRSTILINAEKFLELVRSICKSLFIHTSRPKVKLTSYNKKQLFHILGQKLQFQYSNKQYINLTGSKSKM